MPVSAARTRPSRRRAARRSRRGRGSRCGGARFDRRRVPERGGELVPARARGDVRAVAPAVGRLPSRAVASVPPRVGRSRAAAAAIARDGSRSRCGLGVAAARAGCRPRPRPAAGPRPRPAAAAPAALSSPGSSLQRQHERRRRIAATFADRPPADPHPAHPGSRRGRGQALPLGLRPSDLRAQLLDVAQLVVDPVAGVAGEDDLLQAAAAAPGAPRGPSSAPGRSRRPAPGCRRG